MKEITLRIKNDRLAEDIIALMKKIKEVEILEENLKDGASGGEASLFGYMKDSVKLNGDIIGPINEAWDAEN